MAKASASFSDLPVELKLEILRYRLLIPKPLTAMSHHSHSRRLLLPLALTNKDLNNLACVVYYGENHFVVTRKRNYLHGASSLPFSYPNPAIGMWVRSLEVHFKVQDVVSSAGCGPSDHADETNEWRYLFDRPGDRADYTNWQRCFPKLDNLKVVLDFAPLRGGCLNKRLARMLVVMADLPIAIRAREVEVEVKNLDCADEEQSEARFGNALQCGHACEDRVLRMIQSKFPA